jgi:hypothetical protein
MVETQNTQKSKTTLPNNTTGPEVEPVREVAEVFLITAQALTAALHGDMPHVIACLDASMQFMVGGPPLRALDLTREQKDIIRLVINNPEQAPAFAVMTAAYMGAE